MKNTQVARLLAFVTGMVNQKLLLQNEYIALTSRNKYGATGPRTGTLGCLILGHLRSESPVWLRKQNPLYLLG